MNKNMIFLLIDFSDTDTFGILQGTLKYSPANIGVIIPR